MNLFSGMSADKSADSSADALAIINISCLFMEKTTEDNLRQQEDTDLSTFGF